VHLAPSHPRNVHRPMRSDQTRPHTTCHYWNLLSREFAGGAPHHELRTDSESESAYTRIGNHVCYRFRKTNRQKAALRALVRLHPNPQTSSLMLMWNIPAPLTAIAASNTKTYESSKASLILRSTHCLSGWLGTIANRWTDDSSSSQIGLLSIDNKSHGTALPLLPTTIGWAWWRQISGVGIAAGSALRRQHAN